MYAADVEHPDATLAGKLAAIYELRGGPAIDLTIRPDYLTLLQRLGNPHKNLPRVIHVAGTNGKGSVIAFMRAILEAAGYKVHTYTSPHLVKFNERIVLAGEQISDACLELILDETLAHASGLNLTFFEVTTALAFRAFSQSAADFLLLETGLGGRLDCTNVVDDPAATVITNIGYDHQEFLGPTLSAIAAEKAGIMKPHAPCTIAFQDHVEAAESLKRSASLVSCRIHLCSDTKRIENASGLIEFTIGPMRLVMPPLSLTGSHQIDNAITAVRCLTSLENCPITAAHVEAGLGRAVWPGRLQRLSADGKWEIFFDGGHNESAARALAKQAEYWQRIDGKTLHLVVAMMKTKNPVTFLAPLTPYIGSLTALTLHNEPLCHSASTITKCLEISGIPVSMASDLGAAIDEIKAAYPDGRILVTGSLYLARHAFALPR